MAVWVEAKHHFGARWFFDPQPLCANGHAAIGAGFEGRAHAPHIIPSRAAWGRTQGGALFIPGLIPGPLRRLAQFPMDFPSVAMCPQGVDVRVSGLTKSRGH